MQDFIDSYVAKIKPVEKESNLAYWAAATSGKEEDYAKQSELELKIRQINSNAEEFAFLKETKESGRIKDPLAARQLQSLYYAYLRNQIDAELLKKTVDLSTEIQQKFNVFRGIIKGREVTANEIDEILKTETNSDERRGAWLASKQVGPVIVDDIIELVKLRNEAARKLGFNNYHTMSLTASEQDVKELDELFAELDELTKGPFAEVKIELDGILAKKCGIETSELMPWHYHDVFFQETPLVYELNLDTYYKEKDIETLSRKFFDGIGLNVESILANSDLYERDGKNPHAFCTDIDKAGDVRILCNIVDTERWMEVTLHELGHAVYAKYHDDEVPYLLREPAHAFTTEAIAMFFGRLSRNPVWMQQMLGLSDDQRAEVATVSGKYARAKQLIFVRWALVMFNFEKALYVDPDQDLNTLWWDMVEKYQLVKRPPERNEPDWACKIHFNIAPCYYHNYVIGELFASQMHHHIINSIMKRESDADVSYVGQKNVGDFMREKVFKAGDVYHWNTMIERATGEPLTPKYFAEEFVR